MNIKEFLEYGMFDLFSLPEEIKFVIRQNLCCVTTGKYRDVYTYVYNGDIKDHEIISAKLNFLTYVMEIEIR